RFEGYRTGQARPEILSYRLDFAASQQDTFRVRASAGLLVRPYLYRKCALTCVRFASEASDTRTKSNCSTWPRRGPSSRTKLTRTAAWSAKRASSIPSQRT